VHTIVEATLLSLPLPPPPVLYSTAQSQLRNRLARELQNTLEGSSLPTPPSRGQSSMTMQVANSMVAEYLQKVGFEFTLSVFLPEAGVNMGKVGKALFVFVILFFIPRVLSVWLAAVHF